MPWNGASDYACFSRTSIGLDSMVVRIGPPEEICCRFLDRYLALTMGAPEAHANYDFEDVEGRDNHR
jgi:hypothetical protein